jgi:hypothetical protein
MWIVAYVAIGCVVALIVRPSTPVSWVAHIAGWPLMLLVPLYLAWALRRLIPISL